VENYHLGFNEIQKRELPFFGENTIGTEGNRSRQWGGCRERKRRFYFKNNKVGRLLHVNRY